MIFKDRLNELKKINNSEVAIEGAELCYDTLKTSKAILDDLIGDGKYDSKDLLELYSKLVGCEVECSLKKIYSKTTRTDDDLDKLQLINVRKKLNNLS